ncbi:membrane protein insertase YidC [Ideonella paludis]|uniref:Membrane protein insertase YidC n=1 Tax=Ideonella paludis TaxID=1233411 RepID=A0ABS5DSS1_9BURK|nr:membrane protein insertase YidC [Ideonella paludis]MBQ0934192.1 membrane protein insertase YidC [Ideonella paludis]
MTDMRRTLLWVVFTMSLIMLWDGWNRHTGQPTLFGAPVAKAASGAAAAGSAAGVAAAGGATAAAQPTAPAGQPAEQIVVSTDVLKVTLDGKGGDMRRAELLGYPDSVDPKRNTVLMDTSAERTYLAQTGLISAVAGGAALPNHFTVMTAQPGERTLKDGANEVVVRFESPEVGGVKLVKTYTFKRGQYTVGVKHEVVNVGAAPVQPRLYLQLQRDGNAPAGESAFYFTFTGPAVYTDEKKFEKVEFKDIEKRAPNDKPGHNTSSNDGWVAMVQHYFTSAWLVAPGSPREFASRKHPSVPNLYEVAMLQDLGAIAPGATKAHESTLYVGPQEEKKLAALAPGLELVKDYGWFTILAKPMFAVLHWLHSVLGNWGWSIVALVVLLKAAFYWLNANAYKSMAKMKAVNPRIMELRERLKDKPQEMQQEMMRIYREEKVNPIGGCLPIFVQMPFFIALYWVLLSTVEMRGAPWVGWITDLSAKDPYFILPILMTLSSLLQVWLQPAPADPLQAKMMWLMPLMFSFMFFFFPAGLVLYWLVNNLLSIAQQWMINRQMGVS